MKRRPKDAEQIRLVNLASASLHTAAAIAVNQGIDRDAFITFAGAAWDAAEDNEKGERLPE